MLARSGLVGKILLAPFGATWAHFLRGPEKSKNCPNFAYFSWWANGPYSPALGYTLAFNAPPRRPSYYSPWWVCVFVRAKLHQVHQRALPPSLAGIQESGCLESKKIIPARPQPGFFLSFFDFCGPFLGREGFKNDPEP